jgi:hypothetical protein
VVRFACGAIECVASIASPLRHLPQMTQLITTPVEPSP